MGGGVGENVLVIGVGNMDRGDDGVGLVVARAVRAHRFGKHAQLNCASHREPAQFACTALPLGAMHGAGNPVEVIEHSGDGAALMQVWHDAHTVILIDAVDAGEPPGMVYRIDARAEQLPARFVWCSTHAFGVAEAIELARVLGELPLCLIVYGIQGGTFDVGAPLSPPVRRAARDVVEWVADDVWARLTDPSRYASPPALPLDRAAGGSYAQIRQNEPTRAAPLTKMPPPKPGIVPRRRGRE